MRMHIITISLLQIRQISDMAGVACHGEGYQCPARWMSLTRAECHSDGGPRGGSEGESSCRPRCSVNRLAVTTLPDMLRKQP